MTDRVSSAETQVQTLLDAARKEVADLERMLKAARALDEGEGMINLDKAADNGADAKKDDPAPIGWS